MSETGAAYTKSVSDSAKQRLAHTAPAPQHGLAHIAPAPQNGLKIVHRRLLGEEKYNRDNKFYYKDFAKDVLKTKETLKQLGRCHYQLS